jgi:hypothetical protein
LYHWATSNTFTLFASQNGSTNIAVTTNPSVALANFDGSDSWLTINDTTSDLVNPGAGAILGVSMGQRYESNFMNGLIADHLIISGDDYAVSAAAAFANARAYYNL